MTSLRMHFRVAPLHLRHYHVRNRMLRQLYSQQGQLDARYERLPFHRTRLQLSLRLIRPARHLRRLALNPRQLLTQYPYRDDERFRQLQDTLLKQRTYKIRQQLISMRIQISQFCRLRLEGEGLFVPRTYQPT